MRDMMNELTFWSALDIHLWEQENKNIIFSFPPPPFVFFGRDSLGRGRFTQLKICRELF